MATQKKKGTSWEDVMNIIQERAGRSGQTVTMTFAPAQGTSVPRDERRYIAQSSVRRAQGSSVPADEQRYIAQSDNRPTNKKGKPASTNVVTYQERPGVNNVRPGVYQSGVSPEEARRLAPVRGYQPGARAAESARGYHFTQAQPALAAAAADKIRNQYASMPTSQYGGFVTDANQGLIDLLQRAGINPTPLNQWGQLANRLR